MVIINSLEALALGEILQKSLYAHYKFRHRKKSSWQQNGKRIVININFICIAISYVDCTRPFMIWFLHPLKSSKTQDSKEKLKDGTFPPIAVPIMTDFFFKVMHQSKWSLPHHSNPGKGRDLDKRTKESVLMFLPPGKYFHSNVLAFPCLPVKEHTYFIKNIRASEWQAYTDSLYGFGSHLTW